MMAAPKKPEGERMVIKSFSLPPDLLERIVEAAGPVSLSRWARDAFERRLAEDSGEVDRLHAEIALRVQEEDWQRSEARRRRRESVPPSPVEPAVPESPGLPPEEFPEPGVPTMDLLETCDGPGGVPLDALKQASVPEAAKRLSRRVLNRTPARQPVRSYDPRRGDAMTTMPLVEVERVESNDGVIRVERLACGHTTSLLSSEGYAKRRRCAHCAIGDPDEEAPG